jgi:tetratricopeptide (TPR) repeat protein
VEGSSKDRRSRARAFVSAAPTDRAFAALLSRALREAGVDVWLETASTLEPSSEGEVCARPNFLVVLSQQALACEAVRDACARAYSLAEGEPDQQGRIFLPVMAPGFGPYRSSEAISRVMRKLGLTRPVRVPAPVPKPNSNSGALLLQAHSLATKLFSPDALAQACRLFERATQLDPSDLSAWSGLGDMCALLQRDADALAAFEHAVALAPENAELWCDVGAMRSRLGDHAHALEAYTHALALDPDSPRALEQRGRMLVALHRADEALGAYERALAQHPEEAPLWHAHGNALQELGRHSEAIVSFERALTLWPHFTLVWRDQAASLRALGREAEAREAEQRAEGWTL